MRALGALGDEVVVDLAASRTTTRFTFFAASFSTSGITVWNAPLARSASGEAASFLRSRLLGVITMSGFLNRAHHLAAEHVEDLRRRCDGTQTCMLCSAQSCR